MTITFDTLDATVESLFPPAAERAKHKINELVAAALLKVQPQVAVLKERLREARGLRELQRRDTQRRYQFLLREVRKSGGATLRSTRQEFRPKLRGLVLFWETSDLRQEQLTAYRAGIEAEIALLEEAIGVVVEEYDREVGPVESEIRGAEAAMREGLQAAYRTARDAADKAFHDAIGESPSRMESAGAVYSATESTALRVLEESESDLTGIMHTITRARVAVENAAYWGPIGLTNPVKDM